MKRILRHYVIDTFSLWTVTQIASGIILEKGYESLLLAGIGMTAVSLLAKPIINLLILPLNLITFGLFRWVSSAIILYIVTLIVPGFKIEGFRFSGLSSVWIDLPSVNLEGILTFVAFSFLLSLITSFVYWLVK